MLLDAAHADPSGLQRLDPLHRRSQTLHGRDAWDALDDGRGADVVPVDARPGADGGVDHEVHLTGQDAAHGGGLAVGADAFGVFPQNRRLQSVATQDVGRTPGGEDLEPEIGEALHREDHRALVPVGHGDDGPSGEREAG